MGCSSYSNEELESKIIKLQERRNEIIALKKRKIKRLEKLTAQKIEKEIVPDCFDEKEKEKWKKAVLIKTIHYCYFFDEFINKSYIYISIYFYLGKSGKACQIKIKFVDILNILFYFDEL